MMKIVLLVQRFSNNFGKIEDTCKSAHNMIENGWFNQIKPTQSSAE